MRHESDIEEKRKEEDVCACVESVLCVHGDNMMKVACIHIKMGWEALFVFCHLALVFENISTRNKEFTRSTLTKKTQAGPTFSK